MTRNYHFFALAFCACTVYHHDAYIRVCKLSLPPITCANMWDELVSHPVSGQTCTPTDNGTTITCTPITTGVN